MLARLRKCLFPPFLPTPEERIEQAVLEAKRAISEKDGFTTIPAIGELSGRTAIEAQFTQLDPWDATIPPSLRESEPDWPIIQVTWEVPTARAGIVYLQVERTPYLNDERHVVVVEARAFYALWRTTRGKPWGFASLPAEPGQFPSIRKWKDQAECWAPGKANPVPIPIVGCSIRHGMSVGFEDGITRTSWLLHHGAAAFPVLLRDPASAAELNEYAGAGLAPPATVEELTRPASSLERDGLR